MIFRAAGQNSDLQMGTCIAQWRKYLPDKELIVGKGELPVGVALCRQFALG